MGWYCRFPIGSLGRTPPLAEVRTVVQKQTPYHVKSTDESQCFLRGGRGWIRTTEVGDVRFTVWCIWPLCNPPILNFYPAHKCGREKLELAIGIEPTTCWLQISCSASWATPAKLNKNSGALGWNRTADIRIFSPALYQLSYQGENAARQAAEKKFGDPKRARTVDLQRDRLAL